MYLTLIICFLFNIFNKCANANVCQSDDVACSKCDVDNVNTVCGINDQLEVSYNHIGEIACDATILPKFSILEPRVLFQNADAVNCLYFY